MRRPPGRTAVARVALLALALAAALAPSPAPAFAGRILEGRVARIADGDTLMVAAPGAGKVKVRLYGIDAPEVRHERTPGQQFGREARQALKALTLGRNVRVEVIDIDTHGRTVGVVYESGVDINRAMVREGWAWAYRRHLSAPYASGYIGAEREARAGRRGLWSQANPMPPWEFRRRTR